MATLRVIDGSYVLDWRDREGVRHRNTLGRVDILPEKQAREILKRRQLELAPGFLALNSPAAPTFAEFAVDYLKWHAAEYPTSHARVAQIIDDHLMPEFAQWRLDAIHPKDVERWKHRRLAPDVAGKAPRPQTVTKELRTLKAILNKAVEWKELVENPIPYVAAPKSLDSAPPRFFTREELNLLYAASRAVVRGAKSEPLHAHIWRLFANTGLRRAEGLMLKWSCVSQDGIKILSTDEGRTKSGKWREIPLNDAAREALLTLPIDSEYVLPRMAPESLSRACINDIRRARLKGSLHTLRHTYISHLVMAGVPLRTVQVMAGHSTIVVTEKYAHLTPGHLQAAGQTINL